MLQQAQQKVKALGLTNIKFEEADADEQKLRESRFDAILCSSAIVYLTDIPSSLRQWHSALKPGGIVAFSCLAETSPSASILFREVVQDTVSLSQTQMSDLERLNGVFKCLKRLD
jgi:ubiquinone/menaquinone biosynthesis C-methylase UbiE